MLYAGCFAAGCSLLFHCDDVITVYVIESLLFDMSADACCDGSSRDVELCGGVL